MLDTALRTKIITSHYLTTIKIALLMFDFKQSALDYHALTTAGKIAVTFTKTIQLLLGVLSIIIARGYFKLAVL